MQVYQHKFDIPIEEKTQHTGPVTCLGLEFKDDMARKEYFTQELQKKLQDPEFRKIEGFPIAKDEDILALSDPPYYTACPNPWISQFVEEWESQKPPKEPDYKYHREPFAADVSEGKNHPIYNAHSYHTKVPHRAIMRYILHYTEPGDIVFDGFCGTGMTGVAAQMCGDRKEVEALGYEVKEDGTILQQELDESGKLVWVPFSKLGARKAVLNDLSPAATFIAYNYNTPVDVEAFEREAQRILAEVEQECGWMYETMHTDSKDSKIKGKINYTVWSDVFVCPECTTEIVFWEAAVDKEAGKVCDEFDCPNCSATLTKRKMERAWVTKYDTALKESIRQAKQVPVLINYSVGNKRHEKTPDSSDLELVKKIEQMEIPYCFPTEQLPNGYNTQQPIKSHGITHVHHFYTKRNLCVLSSLLTKSDASPQRNLCRFLFQQWAVGLSLLNRYSPTHFSQNNRNLSGTLYVGSQVSEVSPAYAFYNKLSRLLSSFGFLRLSPSIITQQDASAIATSTKSIDYIFIDPPFGANLMYSELSFLWESWLKVFTNNKSEAIENKVQGKGINEYRQLMLACFKEAYRTLKPGRWMTVEFSNTKSSVWNAIQTAISEAGFIVANVSALDKQQGSFKAVTTTTAVKQDLIISAYKPNGGFEKRFSDILDSGGSDYTKTSEAVWEFVRTHLSYLPITKKQGNELVAVPERDPRILYDQLIAYYVRKGYTLPIDSQEFQLGLSQRFPERDGMYFLPDQVSEYDRKKMNSSSDKPIQLTLFVQDEATAIDWLRSLLRDKPQTFQDINPKFMQEINGWSKNETRLELSTLLEQNFLCYDGKSEIPSQIHSHLSTWYKELRNLPKNDPALIAKAKDRWYLPDPRKAGDLEKMRERALLKEFAEYVELANSQRKLKEFRLEAVRAGFKKAWQTHDYALIIKVAEKIPTNVLEEDPKLLMWYDQAMTRLEDQ